MKIITTQLEDKFHTIMRIGQTEVDAYDTTLIGSIIKANRNLVNILADRKGINLVITTSQKPKCNNPKPRNTKSIIHIKKLLNER